MLIRTLSLRDIRCFDATRLDFDPRLTVLLGENGAGKTTVAEALASFVAGEDEGLPTLPARRGGAGPSIGLTLDDSSTLIWDATRRDRLHDRQRLLAYGRYRRVRMPDTPVSRPGGPDLLGPQWTDAFIDAPLVSRLPGMVSGRRTTSLFRCDHNLLRDLEGSLVDIYVERDRDPTLGAIWRGVERAITTIGEGLERIEVTDVDDRPVALIHRHGEALPLSALSDGFQSVLVIVLDMILRYAHWFAAEDDPLAGAAVVVIDEIDLHLHPRWQRRVVQQLTGLFPGTQFIITTHSPAVVQGAIDAGHRVVTLRTAKGRVQVKRLSQRHARRLSGAQLGSLLVERGLFDVPSRYSAQVEVLESRVVGLDEKVEAGAATAADRAALLAALEELEGLQARETERRADSGLLASMGRTRMAFLRELERLLAETEGGA